MYDNLPNFLIVGAPKSGTTSIFNYLSQHPQIYMCPIKEPRFITAQFLQFPLKGIGDDKVEKQIIKDFDSYKSLFKDVKEELAIGEASVDTLYRYKDAIKIIKKYFGEVKIIIILRNPIQRAFSQYSHLIRQSREFLSFGDALKAEGERKSMNWAFGWFYKDVGLYYEQVDAYLKNFKEVKVLLYDELIEDPLTLIQDIYSFLGVRSNFSPDIKIKYNVSGVPKIKFIHTILNKPNFLKSLIKSAARLVLNEDKIKRLKNTKEKIIGRNLEKQQLSLETKEYLINFYRENILKLQCLLNKDLSNWLV
jgi:hypothetical protein